MSENKALLGAHISIAGGFDKSVTRAESIDCTTMQIFTKSNKSWFGKTIEKQDAIAFKKALKTSNLSSIMVHSSYLINLAAKNPEVEKKSIKALTDELDRCQTLSIEYLVLHPGAHVGGGENSALKKIAHNLDVAFKTCPGPAMVLLETAAGAGTNVGHTFEQLRTIYDASQHKNRLGICLDTCHVFAAGYDIHTQKGYQDMWKQFRNVLGIHLLKAIHFNNSKEDLGSRKDRHEKIEKGKIPLKIFEMFMKDAALKEVPKILETPVEDSFLEYEHEIALLRNIAS